LERAKGFHGCSQKDLPSPIQEKEEVNLIELEKTYAGKYDAAKPSWQNNCVHLLTFFAFPQEIRRLVYTTNTVEDYYRQFQENIQITGSFPTEQAV
jgi:transposase-like protein